MNKLNSANNGESEQEKKRKEEEKAKAVFARDWEVPACAGHDGINTG
jgi:hypothetical protein